MAYALFAHCFTCGKDVLAAKRIAEGLTMRGIAVLRFDFTGLGASEGEFANTTFSSNVADLVAAANHLRKMHRAPGLLIGHSLGGAAVLAAAQHCPEARAVVTIAAPADPAHVTGLFREHIPEIEEKGEREVALAGRPFRIRKEFLDDVSMQKLEQCLRELRKALLVMHSPTDDLVGIENASAIFTAAKHPKSFISLSGADHLVSKRADGAYVADVIAAWSARYLDMLPEPDMMPIEGVLVAETGNGKFEQSIIAGPHRYLADEPISLAATNDVVIVAHPSVPARTMAELVALMKGGAKLTFSSGGAGAVTHLLGEQLRLSLGIDFVHVPYSGAGPAIAAVVAGHVPVSISSSPPAMPHIADGRLRALAVSGKRRSLATDMAYAIFTHLLLAESLNTLFAMFDG